MAVDPERTEEPVRSFGAFTRDLEEMAAWLASCGVLLSFHLRVAARSRE